MYMYMYIYIYIYKCMYAIEFQFIARWHSETPNVSVELFFHPQTTILLNSHKAIAG